MCSPMAKLGLVASSICEISEIYSMLHAQRSVTAAFRFLYVIFSMCLTLSCSRSASLGNRDHDPSFTIPSIDGLSLTHEGDFAGGVSNLIPLSDGGVVVMGTRRPFVGDSESGFLERLGPGGDAIYSRSTPHGGAYASAAAHQDGSLTLLEYREIPDFLGLWSLDLVGLDPLGRESGRTELNSFSEKIFDVAGDCYLNSKPVFANTSSAAIASIDGDILLSLYACYQHVVMRLSHEHQIVWFRRLTPALPSRWLYERSMMIADKGDSTIRMLIDPVDLEDLKVAVEFLGFSLPSDGAGRIALLVDVDRDTGDILRVNSIGLGESQRIQGAAAQNRSFYLFGTQSRKNPSGASKLQNDLFLSAWSQDSMELRWSRAFNFGNEQMPAAIAFAKSGEIVLGGYFGHVVVDTGSTIQFPDGFLAGFDWRDGAFLGGSVLKTERGDVVHTIVSTHDNEFLVGGSLDGPITHTADNDRSLGYSKGFTLNVALEKIVSGGLRSR